MDDAINTPNSEEFQDYSPRPIFPNDARNLSPDMARRAIFVIAIGTGGEDKRDHTAKTVASCEGGGACAIGAAP